MIYIMIFNTGLAVLKQFGRSADERLDGPPGKRRSAILM